MFISFRKLGKVGFLRKWHLPSCERDAPMGSSRCHRNIPLDPNCTRRSKAHVIRVARTRIAGKLFHNQTTRPCKVCLSDQRGLHRARKCKSAIPNKITHTVLMMPRPKAVKHASMSGMSASVSPHPSRWLWWTQYETLGARIILGAHEQLRRFGLK